MTISNYFYNFAIIVKLYKNELNEKYSTRKFIYKFYDRFNIFMTKNETSNEIYFLDLDYETIKKSIFKLRQKKRTRKSKQKIHVKLI